MLSFYLGNGFNIGDTEYKKELPVNLSLKSKELDTYFVGREEGKDVPTPQLSMSLWWKDLLEAISRRRATGWVESGFILLNSTQEDQEKFEGMFKQLMTRVRAGTTRLLRQIHFFQHRAKAWIATQTINERRPL